jgi:sugar phosphate isomerase/epimerase
MELLKILIGKPKIGMSLYTYGADLKRDRMSVKECIEHAAGLGVEGIELVDKQHIPNYPHQSVYDLQELRDYIESFGMKVSCYSTYCDTMVKSGHWATEEEQMAMIEEDIAEAKVLGAKVVRFFVVPGDPQILSKLLRGHTYEKFHEYFLKENIKIVKKVLPVLKEYKVKWGDEVHAPRPPKSFVTLAKAIDDEYYGLIPDFSAWQTKGFPTEFGMSSFNLLREIMPYTVHVHAKAHVFDDKGEEPNTPYDRLITIISECGFNGYISAEYEGWWFGTYIDSKKIAKTHVKLIQRYI